MKKAGKPTLAAHALNMLAREAKGELEELFAWYESTLGFVPNSFLAMGHKPALLRAFVDLMRQVWAPGSVPGELKALVALVASVSAGCRYCQAHGMGRAAAHGASAEKIAAVWDFEQSPLFGDAERAALRLARDAAQVPNAVSEAHFDELRAHFDDEALVELMATIAAFGFLNRWNDTLATTLEEPSLRLAADTAGTVGWIPGKHASHGGERASMEPHARPTSAEPRDGAPRDFDIERNGIRLHALDWGGRRDGRTLVGLVRPSEDVSGACHSPFSGVTGTGSPVSDVTGCADGNWPLLAAHGNVGTACHFPTPGDRLRSPRRRRRRGAHPAIRELPQRPRVALEAPIERRQTQAEDDLIKCRYPAVIDHNPYAGAREACSPRRDRRGRRLERVEACSCSNDR